MDNVWLVWHLYYSWILSSQLSKIRESPTEVERFCRLPPNAIWSSQRRAFYIMQRRYWCGIILNNSVERDPTKWLESVPSPRHCKIEPTPGYFSKAEPKHKHEQPKIGQNMWNHYCWTKLSIIWGARLAKSWVAQPRQWPVRRHLNDTKTSLKKSPNMPFSKNDPMKDYEMSRLLSA